MTLEQHVQGFPSLGAFFNFVNSSTLLRGSRANMDILYRKYGEEYLTFADEVLATVKLLGFDPNPIFERYILEYIRDLVRFQKAGMYNNGTFEEIKARVYDNDKLMAGTYLPGLFVAYGFTTLLHEKYKLFERSFLPHLRADMNGVEVGFGDGFFLWTILRKVAGINVAGVDISPSALEFTNRLLSASGFAPDRYSLALGDVSKPVPIQNASQDWCVVTEVIEHVSDRFFMMAEITRFMKPGGLLFLTTVKDCNHMDHVWNPESPEEVADLIRSYGYTIEDQLVYVVKEEFKGLKDDAIGLAYVGRKK